MAENGSPALENLPKVDADLKSQLEHFNHESMKKAATHEKIVLPTAEGTYFTTIIMVLLLLLISFFKFRKHHEVAQAFTYMG